MGENLRRLLEEGVRVAYGARPELARFVSTHHVSPSLAQLLGALRFRFESCAEALAWLDRRLPGASRTPFDMIANGEAARLVRASASIDLSISA